MEIRAQRPVAGGSRGMRESPLGGGRGGGDPPSHMLEFCEAVNCQLSSHKMPKLEYFALHRARPNALKILMTEKNQILSIAGILSVHVQQTSNKLTAVKIILLKL